MVIFCDPNNFTRIRTIPSSENIAAHCQDNEYGKSHLITLRHREAAQHQKVLLGSPESPGSLSRIQCGSSPFIPFSSVLCVLDGRMQATAGCAKHPVECTNISYSSCTNNQCQGRTSFVWTAERASLWQPWGRGSQQFCISHCCFTICLGRSDKIPGTQQCKCTGTMADREQDTTAASSLKTLYWRQDSPRLNQSPLQLR